MIEHMSTLNGFFRHKRVLSDFLRAKRSRRNWIATADGYMNGRLYEGNLAHKKTIRGMNYTIFYVYTSCWLMFEIIGFEKRIGVILIIQFSQTTSLTTDMYLEKWSHDVDRLVLAEFQYQCQKSPNSTYFVFEWVTGNSDSIHAGFFFFLTCRLFFIFAG